LSRFRRIDFVLSQVESVTLMFMMVACVALLHSFFERAKERRASSFDIPPPHAARLRSQRLIGLTKRSANGASPLFQPRIPPKPLNHITYVIYSRYPGQYKAASRQWLDVLRRSQTHNWFRLSLSHAPATRSEGLTFRHGGKAQRAEIVPANMYRATPGKVEDPYVYPAPLPS
jgi:hypothetical protein